MIYYKQIKFVPENIYIHISDWLITKCIIVTTKSLKKIIKWAIF